MIKLFNFLKPISKEERESIKYHKDLIKYNERQKEYDKKIKDKVQKHKFKSILSILNFETYTKRLVAFVVAISVIDLQLSYVLAFLNKDQIAESLSSQVCVTLLGTVLVYAIRAYFDTKAEKRDEMIKEGYITATDKNVSAIKKAVDDKVAEVLYNSGISEHTNNDASMNDIYPDDM